MSGKLYLPARVPSVGAHRLAWWLIGARSKTLCRERMARAADLLGPNTVDRILSGELVPASAMGATIAMLTNGYVGTRDFYRPWRAVRRWGTPPVDFYRAEA